MPAAVQRSTELDFFCASSVDCQTWSWLELRGDAVKWVVIPNERHPLIDFNSLKIFLSHGLGSLYLFPCSHRLPDSGRSTNVWLTVLVLTQSHCIIWFSHERRRSNKTRWTVDWSWSCVQARSSSATSRAVVRCGPTRPRWFSSAATALICASRKSNTWPCWPKRKFITTRETTRPWELLAVNSLTAPSWPSSMLVIRTSWAPLEQRSKFITRLVFPYWMYFRIFTTPASPLYFPHTLARPKERPCVYKFTVI